jgi:hypothetical protein
VLLAVENVHVAAAEDRILDHDVADGLATLDRCLQRRRRFGLPAARFQIDACSFHFRRFHIFTNVVRIVCEGLPLSYS